MLGQVLSCVHLNWFNPPVKLYFTDRCKVVTLTFVNVIIMMHVMFVFCVYASFVPFNVALSLVKCRPTLVPLNRVIYINYGSWACPCIIHCIINLYYFREVHRPKNVSSLQTEKMCSAGTTSRRLDGSSVRKIKGS